jgi:hypothetical protein
MKSRSGLRPGDVVSRPKGPVTHVGVVVDGGGVLHNTPGRGEHVSSVAAFAAGRPLRVERHAESDRHRLAAAASGHGPRGRYHLLANNCEHLVSRVRDGRADSPQVSVWALGVVGAVAGTLLTRHWAGTVAGWELGRRLGGRRGRR